jgi:uncharacterized membrane protein
LLSLLLFPAVYWLCLELFESPLTGWVAVALFAVSPIHLVYAQEARQYGFWSALILGSSALLLRAIRLPSLRNWLLYAMSMAIAAYTALFTLWVAIGHLAYTVVVDRKNQLTKRPFRVGKRTLLCVCALLIAALLFTPWTYFLIGSAQVKGTTSWVAVPLPFITTVQLNTLNFTRSFFDFNVESNNLFVYALAILILALQGYAVYVLCRTAPLRISWFILTFVGSTALAYALPDLLFGGQRFTVTRYLFPCFMGLQIAVAYLIASFLENARKWKRRFATLTFSFLIILGILSCSVYSQSVTWSNKVINSHYNQIAEIINSSDRPLIITDSFGYNPASMISLSYFLKPSTPFLLLPPVGSSFPVKEIPSELKNVFLINLPEVFRRQFETRYQHKLTLAFQDIWNEVWVAKW